jgi:hypothetical protein
MQKIIAFLIVMAVFFGASTNLAIAEDSAKTADKKSSFHSHL